MGAEPGAVCGTSSGHNPPARARQLLNTTWREYNIAADTHLFVASTGYFIYANAAGAFCNASASGFVGQYTFSDPSTYAGFTLFDGQKVMVFNATTAGLTTLLYVDPEAGVPVGMLVTYPLYSLASLVQYAGFEAVSDFADPTLFAVPSNCPAASQLEQRGARSALASAQNVIRL